MAGKSRKPRSRTGRKETAGWSKCRQTFRGVKSECSAWATTPLLFRPSAFKLPTLSLNSRTMSVMMFEGILFSLFLSLAPLYPSPQKPVAISKTDVNERFLLQVSYEQENGLQDFMTSRSRIVDFSRQEKVLRMVEEPHDSATPPHLLATIPIRSETAQALMVDFNA